MGFPFQAEFSVPAAPAAVLTAFADVPAMAGLMPGAQIDGQDEDGQWRGGMLVAFGPKRIRFNGKLRLTLDPAQHRGEMVGRGSADARAARVESRIRFTVRAIGTGSLVAIDAETDMTGVLADFARSGGPVVARALLEQFSARLRDHLGPPAATAPVAPEPVVAAAGSNAVDVAGGIQTGASASAPPGAAPASQGAATPPGQAPAALSVTTLLGTILRQWLRRLAGRA